MFPDRSSSYCEYARTTLSRSAREIQDANSESVSFES